MSAQLVVELAAYAVSVGCLYGALSTRLRVLEKKVDLHNHLVERMYRAEMKIKLVEERMEEVFHHE